MRLKLVSSLAILLGRGAATLLAGPISLTPGTWLEQYEIMGASGEYFAADYVAAQAEPVLVSGYYENTDRYEIYVNGTAVLKTTAVPGPVIDYGDAFGTNTDPSTATYSSGLFSTGEFDVSAGDVISIQDIGPLYPDFALGGFDAQVGIEAIPEPGALGLIGLTFLAAAVCFRRSRAGVS